MGLANHGSISILCRNHAKIAKRYRTLFQLLRGAFNSLHRLAPSYSEFKTDWLIECKLFYAPRSSSDYADNSFSQGLLKLSDFRLGKTISSILKGPITVAFSLDRVATFGNLPVCPVTVYQKRAAFLEGKSEGYLQRKTRSNTA